MDRYTLLNKGKQILSEKGKINAYTESLTLLSSVLNTATANLLAHPKQQVSICQTDQFLKLIQRRFFGEPLPYLIEHTEFWSLPFKVTKDCLIPRPDTETIINSILAYYAFEEKKRVLDLGTGSGIIAIVLKQERPHWQIVATDQSQNALQIAKYNAKQLNVGIQFRQGDWLKAICSEALFDIIISNPPYLSQHDKHLQALQYEPQQALIGGPQGTEILCTLIEGAIAYLAPEGRLWVEQGFDQAKAVQSYFKQCKYIDIQQYRDLNGILRVSSGKVSI